MSYAARVKRRKVKDPKRKWDFEEWWYIVLQNLKGILTATRILIGLGRKVKKRRRGRISHSTRLAMLGLGAKCVKCGADRSKNKELTLDHILPASKGGRGNRKNLQVMCITCNQNKGSKTKRYYQPELKVSIKERIEFRSMDFQENIRKNDE